MADLTAADVTVTLTQDDIDRSPDRVGLRTYPSIAFGNGAKTYPALGIPMPAIGKFGLNFAIKRAYIEQPANGYVYHFDRANHKLRIFQAAGFTPAGTIGQITPAGTNSVPVLTDGSLRLPWAPGAGDIKGSENTDSMLADQAGKPTNADRIDTLHAVLAGPAWAYSEDAEVDVPRNACILLKGAAGGSVIPAGDYKFTVTGLFRGAAQEEVITFTFAGVEGTIAENQHRYLYGTKPFDSITSVAIDPTDLADLPLGLLIGVGIGSKLGFPVNSDTGADADFVKATKNAADFAIAGQVDHTNKTVNFGSLADGDEVYVEYLIDMDQGPISAPVFSGTPVTPVFTGTPVAAGTLAELGNVAVPATVLNLELVGR